jgi:two-component system OmpR family response regulator
MIGVKNHELLKATAKDSLAIPRNPGILIVDDMEFILRLLKFELEPRGFNVWLAVDGDDALDLYRRNGAEIDLVLLDVQMPGLDGPHTLAILQRFDPDVRACFMTGNSGTYTEEDLLERGAACVFNKPFRTDDVAQYLQNLVECADSTTLTDRSPRRRRGTQCP